MPSYGETQKAAGVNRPCGCALLQDKKIPCRNVKLHCDPKPTLKLTLLVVTIGYTAHKWYAFRKDRNEGSNG
jgi:hypothetical protein